MKTSHQISFSVLSPPHLSCPLRLHGLQLTFWAVTLLKRHHHLIYMTELQLRSRLGDNARPL